MSRLVSPLSLLILVADLTAGSIAGLQPAKVRIITSANVTVRQGPTPQAPAVAQLPLGTEVSDAGGGDLEKTWVRIVTPDRKEGWVLASLTRPLDGYWKWQTQEQVITDRLGRKGDGFAANVELVNFIERIGDTFTDPDGRARIDLYWLRAVQQTLLAIPFNGARRDPYRTWLDRYKGWAVYSEPGAAWLVRTDAIWKVHDTRASTTAADDLAWLTVTVGLPGECEGHLACYFEARNRMHGEYLRRHPSGARAAEAVAAIGKTAALLSAPTTKLPADSFDPTQDCAPFVVSLDALKSAVEKAQGASDRDATLTALAAFRRKCQ